MITLRSHGLTDRGRVRARNEDQFLIARLQRALRVEESSFSQPSDLFGDQCDHLFVVADGMGGHNGGQQASELAVRAIEDFTLDAFKWFFRLRGESLLAEFQQALRSADARIFDAVERHPELKGMGTTVTMAFVSSGVLYVAHAGDSRCYLKRGGELYQITRDHTLTQELLREGALQPRDVPHNPFRNVITNAVGGSERGVDAEAHKLQLEHGDTLLLCSDGLTGMVADNDITALLADGTPDAAADRLIDAANAAGGRDNITAVVAQFLEAA